MTQNVHRALLAAALLGVAFPTPPWIGLTAAQQASLRAIKHRAEPEYAERARRMNLSGRVKIEVVIDPAGGVVSARGLGGHPVLLRAAITAIREWKLLPTSKESSQIVELEFNGAKLH